MITAFEIQQKAKELAGSVEGQDVLEPHTSEVTEMLLIQMAEWVLTRMTSNPLYPSVSFWTGSRGLDPET